MGSSFVSLIISGTTNSANIFFIDMTLNVLCIILMTPYYKGWYRNLCCCCIKTCIMCCLCSREQQIAYQNYMMKGIKKINVQATASINDPTSGVTNKKTSRFTQDSAADNNVLGTPIPEGSQNGS